MDPGNISRSTQIIPASLGRYRLDGVLGSGGMGTVYRARDPIIGRAVAIKVMRTDHIKPEHRPEFLTRFAQEVRAAAACTHPAIVAVHDVGGDLQTGSAEHPPFIVMELVEGLSLGERLRDPSFRATLSPIALLLPILDALGMVHHLGVVHRDVKPGNILLAPRGQPKLTDFGIARLSRVAEQSGLTQTGTMIGTPQYMAPEQARGGETDHRADLFSVGCILYEVLVGQTPFGGGSLGETMLRLLGPEPAPLEPIVRIAPRFADLLTRALAKRVEERFSSAEEVATALRSAGEVPVPRDMTFVSAEGINGTGASVVGNRLTGVTSNRETGHASHFEPAFLTALGDELVTYLGPIAPTLVRRAAALAADSESLRRTLAAHLDKPELRSSFLRRTGDALSPAGGGTISSSGAAGMVAPPPADLIPTEALVAAQGVLAEQIGPIAALIVKRAASEATSPVHFIEKIAAQVPIDERLRGRLHDAMQGNLRH